MLSHPLQCDHRGKQELTEAGGTIGRLRHRMLKHYSNKSKFLAKTMCQACAVYH